MDFRVWVKASIDVHPFLCVRYIIVVQGLAEIIDWVQIPVHKPHPFMHIRYSNFCTLAQLSKSNMARGPLAIAAGVYAKKLTDASEATVFELHGRRQYVRFWELTGKGKQNGEAKLLERDHVAVPKNLKRVVSGVVVNQVTFSRALTRDLI